MDARVAALVKSFFTTADRVKADSSVGAIAVVEILCVIAATQTVIENDGVPLEARIDVLVDHLRARHPQVLAEIALANAKKVQLT